MKIVDPAELLSRARAFHAGMDDLDDGEKMDVIYLLLAATTLGREKPDLHEDATKAALSITAGLIMKQNGVTVDEMFDQGLEGGHLVVKTREDQLRAIEGALGKPAVRRGAKMDGKPESGGN